jgi:putative heme-binding domain-containing protein
MPYLASELVDDAGIALLREWIYSLVGKADSIGALSGQPGSTSEALQLAHAALSLPPAARAELARDTVRSSNPLFRELFDRFLPADEQTTTIHQETASPEQILRLKGDAKRGAALLANNARLSCLQCHTYGTSGRLFGPDLGQSARAKTREDILESILQPSRQIAPEYVLYTLELLDDEIVTGIIQRRTEKEIALRDAAGMDQVIAASQIKTIRPQQLSAMPEGLLAGISPQEIADLIEALASPED